jgi:outer membrane biosynthesis protein TonB
MSETTNTVTTPKTEVKPTAPKAAAPKAAAKPAAPKAETKTAVAPKAAEKTKVAAPKKKEVSSKNEATLIGIAEDQLDATAETIINALNTLDQQLKDARITGSDRAKEIVNEFGGENKLTDLISKLAGYMGEAAGAGMLAGMSPMIVMAGAAKGVYKKITD